MKRKIETAIFERNVRQERFTEHSIGLLSGPSHTSRVIVRFPYLLAGKTVYDLQKRERIPLPQEMLAESVGADRTIIGKERGILTILENDGSRLRFVIPGWIDPEIQYYSGSFLILTHRKMTRIYQRKEAEFEKIHTWKHHPFSRTWQTKTAWVGVTEKTAYVFEETTKILWSKIFEEEIICLTCTDDELALYVNRQVFFFDLKTGAKSRPTWKIEGTSEFESLHLCATKAAVIFANKELHVNTKTGNIVIPLGIKFFIALFDEYFIVEAYPFQYCFKFGERPLQMAKAFRPGYVHNPYIVVNQSNSIFTLRDYNL